MQIKKLTEISKLFKIKSMKILITILNWITMFNSRKFNKEMIRNNKKKFKTKKKAKKKLNKNSKMEIQMTICFNKFTLNYSNTALFF